MCIRDSTITGIADAMIDSTPVVVIAGQVATGFLGTDAFQEVDLVGITPVSYTHLDVYKRQVLQIRRE